MTCERRRVRSLPRVRNDEALYATERFSRDRSARKSCSSCAPTRRFHPTPLDAAAAPQIVERWVGGQGRQSGRITADVLALSAAAGGRRTERAPERRHRTPPRRPPLRAPNDHVGVARVPRSPRSRGGLVGGAVPRRRQATHASPQPTMPCSRSRAGASPRSALRGCPRGPPAARYRAWKSDIASGPTECGRWCRRRGGSALRPRARDGRDPQVPGRVVADASLTSSSISATLGGMAVVSRRFGSGARSRRIVSGAGCAG